MSEKYNPNQINQTKLEFPEEAKKDEKKAKEFKFSNEKDSQDQILEDSIGTDKYLEELAIWQTQHREEWEKELKEKEIEKMMKEYGKSPEGRRIFSQNQKEINRKNRKTIELNKKIAKLREQVGVDYDKFNKGDQSGSLVISNKALKKAEDKLEKLS